MMIGRIGTQSTSMNAAAINLSTSHKNKVLYGKQQEEKIQAIISPAGKKQNLIQQLMKQKQELTDQMNSLSADSAESGVSIKDQMKQYQKQLETLNEQITQLQTQQEEEKQNEKSEAPGIYEKPKTKTELETERFQNIVELSASLTNAETIFAVKDSIDGRANVLKAEIESGFGNIEAKLEDVSELEQKSLDVASQIAENIRDISEQSKETLDAASEKETSEKETSEEA